MQVLYWKTLAVKSGLLSIQNCHAAEIQLMKDYKKNVATYIDCIK
jgi:hypothetical protein